MKITILGAGKLGISIAQALLIGKHEITIVDKNPEIIDRLSSRMDLQSVCVNAKDVESLKELDVDKSDVVIACTDNDDKNMVLCALAKEFGVKRCISRVRSPEHVEHLSFIKSAMKIDHIINPDYACAVEVYKHITKRDTIADGIRMINGVAIIEFPANAVNDLAGGLVREKSGLLNGLLAVAVSRNGKIIIPNGNTQILDEDRIYAVGSKTDALDFRKNLTHSKDEKHINNAMIAGGGKTGFFLAKLLTEDGINVKIIENDLKRGKHLAEFLDKASIVYGDATDQDLLFEEDFDHMDAFVACTGFDEENILLALMANKRGIDSVVAKISRRSYGPIMENLGDAMTINPIELCTANVIRYINDDKNLKFSRLIQGQAEFTEVVVEKDMPVVDKQLAELKLSEGILIGAIHRGSDIIIPNGSTKIELGDRLTILSLLSNVPEIEKLISDTNSGEF